MQRFSRCWHFHGTRRIRRAEGHVSGFSSLRAIRESHLQTSLFSHVYELTKRRGHGSAKRSTVIEQAFHRYQARAVLQISSVCTARDDRHIWRMRYQSCKPQPLDSRLQNPFASRVTGSSSYFAIERRTGRHQCKTNTRRSMIENDQGRRRYTILFMSLDNSKQH